MIARVLVLCLAALGCLSPSLAATAQTASASSPPPAGATSTITAASAPPAAAAPEPAPEEVTHFGWYPFNGALRVEGVQIGFANIAKELRGVQIAYGCLQIAADVKGVQIGIGWQGANTVDGLQLGMFTTAKTVRGVQIGLVNYTSKSMSGVQIGAVNISRGAPLALGLVNWTLDGRTDLAATGSSSGFVGGVLRNGGSYHHNIYAVDYHPESRGLRLGIGLGLHGDLGVATLDLDSIAYSFSKPVKDGQARPQFQTDALLWLGIKLMDQLIVSLGSGLTFMRGDSDPGEFNRGIGWQAQANNSGVRWSMWPTASVALRWVFKRDDAEQAEATPSS